MDFHCAPSAEALIHAHLHWFVYVAEKPADGAIWMGEYGIIDCCVARWKMGEEKKTVTGLKTFSVILTVFNDIFL